MMKKFAWNNSNTSGMSDILMRGNTLLSCIPASTDSFRNGLLLIFLEQNGSFSSLQCMDAVMTNKKEAYLKMNCKIIIVLDQNIVNKAQGKRTKLILEINYC